MIILFLNENPLPPKFTRGTIAGKELRLRAALPMVKEVHVISRSGKSMNISDPRIGELEAKIHMHLLPPWPYYLAALPLYIVGLYWCFKLKPAVIEAESPIISGPAAVLLGKLFRRPSIVEVRASYIELLQHRFHYLPTKLKRTLLDLVMLSTLKHASAVIANSHFYQRQLQQQGITSTVINPGLQYLPSRPSPFLSRAKSKDDPRPSTLTLGYLGRLVPEKGIDLLIESFNLLSTKSSPLIPRPATHNSQLKLLIAGEGSEKVRLQKQILNSQLSTLISLIGFQPNYHFLSQIDILVNPNLVNHPLEMVNAEAAAVGVPVICFGDNEQPETVVDGVTGIKVKQKSPQALADALIQLIKQPQKRRRLTLEAQQFAKQNYDFDGQCLQLRYLYENLNIIKPATNSVASAPGSNPSPKSPMSSSKTAPR